MLGFREVTIPSPVTFLVRPFRQLDFLGTQSNILDITDPQGRFFIGKQWAEANMFFITQWNPAKREFRKNEIIPPGDDFLEFTSLIKKINHGSHWISQRNKSRTQARQLADAKTGNRIYGCRYCHFNFYRAFSRFVWYYFLDTSQVAPSVCW